jgi:hypothetical protein
VRCRMWAAQAGALVRLGASCRAALRLFIAYGALWATIMVWANKARAVHCVGYTIVDLCSNFVHRMAVHGQGDRAVASNDDTCERTAAQRVPSRSPSL